MSAPTHVDVGVTDVQGRLRTKRVPASKRDALVAGEVRMPHSTLVQDVFGEDSDEATGMGLVDGDPDGFCSVVPHSFTIQPWHPGVERCTASLFGPDGRPSPFDPRTRLADAVGALAARGLTAVVATELEFYLLDGSTRRTGVPKVPEAFAVAGEPSALQLYDTRVMDRAEPVLDTIDTWTDALGVPAETVMAEFGPGQFEINLAHRDDALGAADDAVLLRRIVDRAAFEHGMLACFMAKPYTEHGGSGLHVHASLLDADGRAVFDTPAARVDEALPADAPLAHAVAGLLDALPDAQLVLAPHANSYRRLRPGGFAPHRIDWGHDHRAAAIRLPETSGPGARIEHRVAGSDANPYLVLAAVLGGVLAGLDAGRAPGSAPLRSGVAPDSPVLCAEWTGAIERFAGSAAMASVFGPRFVEVFAAVKRREAAAFALEVGPADWRAGLGRL